MAICMKSSAAYTCYDSLDSRKVYRIKVTLIVSFLFSAFCTKGKKLNLMTSLLFNVANRKYYKSIE